MTPPGDSCRTDTPDGPSCATGPLGRLIWTARELVGLLTARKKRT
jgi:hypothetical protein